MWLSCAQVAEHKRAVDKMLEDKRAMYEAARAAEEREEAARCVGVIADVDKRGKQCYTIPKPNLSHQELQHVVPGFQGVQILNFA